MSTELVAIQTLNVDEFDEALDEVQSTGFLQKFYVGRQNFMDSNRWQNLLFQISQTSRQPHDSRLGRAKIAIRRECWASFDDTVSRARAGFMKLRKAIRGLTLVRWYLSSKNRRS